MITRKRLYIAIAALLLWLIFAAGVAVGTFAIGPARASAAQAVASTADPEAEYHRGLYDLCRMILNGQEQQCIQAVASAREHHWYEEASPGWAWPPKGDQGR